MFVLASMVFISCSKGKWGRGDEFSLNLTLQNGENSLVILEELTPRELVPLDTFATDANGKAHISRTIADVGFYIVRLDNGSFVSLLIEPGEVIELTGNADALLETYTVLGSVGSEQLFELAQSNLSSNRKIDSLAGIFRNNSNSDGFHAKRQEINFAFTKIFETQQQFVIQFIERHPRSLASILALYQMLGNRKLIDEVKHFYHFESLAASLSEVYPENKHVLDLKRNVSEIKMRMQNDDLSQESLSVGSIAPDIVLPDPFGNMIALSSFRGKYVLVDFWAAWCMPCRKANPILREMYHRYKDQGFEIYGISLDRNREQWLQGIQEDQIDWIQVSDLRFWNSPVVALYDVRAIPFYVLIGPDGRIIARGMNLAQLEAMLKDIFS